MMITRALLKSLVFRVFTPNDYEGFAGVNSPVPLIAETNELLVVIDGAYCELYGVANEFAEPLDTCADINSLEA